MVQIKQSRIDDTPFHSMGLVVVKNGWESGDKDSFMPKFSADGLGFAAALWAKLELDTQFPRECFIFYPKAKGSFSVRTHHKGALQSKNWDFDKFESPIPKYDLQCQFLINTVAQHQSIVQMWFPLLGWNWVSALEQRGFTNTMQE